VADLRISELAALAGANLAVGDLLAVADVSASESKKITVTDFLGNAVTLIADATIPNAKILFSSASIPGSALQNGAVDTAQIANDAITSAKLADESTVDLVTVLPLSGAYVGQFALDTDDGRIHVWNGSQWVAFKAAGSINAIAGDTAGILNVTATQTGDSVDIAVTFDDTIAAAQFLAGPSGSAGAVSYRTIVPADLPTATTTAKGAVQVNGNGLTLSGDQIQIDNTVAANTTEHHVVQYDANGLVIGGRLLQASDLPVAQSGAIGGASPGTGLEVDASGVFNHVNTATAGTYTKLTIDAQGHVTTGDTLTDADIPDLAANKITSGEFSADRIANDAITGAKLADGSTVQFGGAGSTAGIVSFPTAEFKGQYFWDELNGDLYIWSGSAWLPVTITSGELIFAGTYDASVNQIDSVTAAGSALGLTVGGALPAASTTNSRYYLVVSASGTGSGNAPAEALAPPDMILSNGTTWELIDVSGAIAGQTATNISVTPAGNISSTNAQLALQELDDEKLGKALTSAQVYVGNSSNQAAAVAFTGDVTLSNTGVTSIAAGAIVNADINASAAIDYSKLAALTSGQIIVGSVANVPTARAVTGDVTISNTGVTSIAAGVIVDADVSASAAIAGSKVVAGTTSARGTLQLTDSTISTSTTTAATPNSVKSAYDLADAALPKSGGTMAGPITFAAGQTITGYGLLDGAQTWTKGQRGEITALTDGATITPDFADSNNFSVTLGGNRTLANPTNLVAGQSGCIWITQDATGGRTLAYDTHWDFTGGTAPTLSTAANAVDCLVYAVQSTTKITATLITNLS
jgi:hypothetical protein